ncbi:MAG: hypothetical protein CVU41_16115 [Chloroflexi bacterium HGW-Chloroflexi-3]|nr:MAG: hypothetical protein CVU41_16115 [Chloroflexi bacterium HGW-Chloroflexi-3]
MSETWQVLNLGAVPGFGYTLAAGFILSILFHWKISREQIPIQIISLITIVMLVVIQRPNIFNRTWQFYFPLVNHHNPS